MSSCVLDASAVLAYLEQETGWDVVASIVDSQEAAISTVNFAEVATRLSDRGASELEIRFTTGRLGLDLHSFDREMALQAGLLRPVTRRLGLSLGDRACLALAQRLNLPVYTADHPWAQLQLGIPIHLIR